MNKIPLQISLKTKRCIYTVLKEITPDIYEATMSLVGDLGSIESNSHVILALGNNALIKIGKKNISPLETFEYRQYKVNVFPNEPDIIKALEADNIGSQKNKWLKWGPHQYCGPLCNNVPNGKGEFRFVDGRYYNGDINMGYCHGKGLMIYPDKRQYNGEFVKNMRHGQGTLVMPSGEYFCGLFQNDQITEDGKYYTADGKERKVNVIGKFGKTFLNRTLNLWISLACFAGAALTVYFLIRFFSEGSGGIIRIGAFILPFVLVWEGFKSLISFLNNKNQ